MRGLLFAGLFITNCLFIKQAYAKEEGYPPEWWAYFDPTDKPEWEILPLDAKKGEVILSKRTELGIFSNFAATAFELDGIQYASVEGFWQMMKFPDFEMQNDPRDDFSWTTTREAVSQLTGFDAKHAGDEGSQVMKDLRINWVTYRGDQMDYRTSEKGRHYDTIRRAMRAKLESNAAVKDLLFKTGNLALMPDHKQEENTPPAWKYYEIWTEFRNELQSKK